MAKYFDNKKFLELFRRYKQNPTEKDKNEICKMFYSIIDGLFLLPCFVNYTKDRKAEMTSNAIYIMYKYMNRFDVDNYDNPHAYFTMVCQRNFWQTIKIYKKRSKYLLPLDFIENISNNDNVDLTKVTQINGDNIEGGIDE